MHPVPWCQTRQAEKNWTVFKSVRLIPRHLFLESLIHLSQWNQVEDAWDIPEHHCQVLIPRLSNQDAKTTCSRTWPLLSLLPVKMFCKEANSKPWGYSPGRSSGPIWMKGLQKENRLHQPRENMLFPGFHPTQNYYLGQRAELMGHHGLGGIA